jgi:hypothetical protein
MGSPRLSDLFAHDKVLTVPFEGFYILLFGVIIKGKTIIAGN